jgi:hypothetical protein
MTAQRSDPGTGILVPERGESKPVGRTVIRAFPLRIYPSSNVAAIPQHRTQ